MKWLAAPAPPIAEGIRPRGVQADLPAIPAVPRVGTIHEHIAAMEAVATAYATEHAPTRGIRPAYLARATLDALAAELGYVPGPVAGGRWTTRPPHPHVLAARHRVAAPAPPCSPIVPPITPADPAPF